MLQDLAALTPPLVVCAAFLIGVVLFLRAQMRAGDSASPKDAESGIHDRSSNADTDDQEAPSSDGRGMS